MRSPGPPSATSEPRQPAGRGITQKTIFDLLGAANISRKIYYSQFPFGSFFSYVQQHMDHVAPISQYYTDAAAGTLPSVSFVDPTFIAAPNTETDEHPRATSRWARLQLGNTRPSETVRTGQIRPCS